MRVANIKEKKLEDVALGKLKSLKLWSCQQDGCQSKFDRQGYNCFYHDYEEDGKQSPSRKSPEDFSKDYEHKLGLLKKIYAEAEKRGIKVWLTGSWAITGRYGAYFKNIRDIDFTMLTKVNEADFAETLSFLGLAKVKEGPMGANRYVDQKSGIEVDFGSITYPGVYYNMPLKDNEVMVLDGFSYRVIPVESHVKVYKYILFNTGQSLRNDLIKIKILLRY